MPPRAPKRVLDTKSRGRRPCSPTALRPASPCARFLSVHCRMLEEHTPQRAIKVGGVSGDAEPWIRVVGYAHLAHVACDGWMRKSDLVDCGGRSVELNGNDEPFVMRRDLVTGQIMIKFSNRSIPPLKLKKDQSHDELALAHHPRRPGGNGRAAAARQSAHIDRSSLGQTRGVPGHRARNGCGALGRATCGGYSGRSGFSMPSPSAAIKWRSQDGRSRVVAELIWNQRE